ncbi:hypothetical protein DFJ63DRAFT_332409 [Scheffersomyces coipomensis]|uniref:uncharacterized protein n=1 Tax=Scheffersomyces coipomensis TaxID=1788519 RepID=UPI00315D41A6
MSIQRLRNVLALRTKNWSRKIQRALEELAEALANESQPQPQPIAIPVRGNSGNRRLPSSTTRNFQRCFGSFTGFNPSSSSTRIGIRAYMFKNSIPNPNANPTSWKFFKFKNSFLKSRLFKFYNFNIFNNSANVNSKIINNLNRQSSGLFHNFSQTYQSGYRLKWYNANVKITYRTLFYNLREKFQVYQENEKSNLSRSKYNAINLKPSISLNLSLNADHHQLTLKLAKTDSSATFQEKFESNQVNNGCYIDFPINFNLNIPNETILSQEILEEMIFNIKMFERKLTDLKQDLNNLFDLGELPIKYINTKNVLRIYFPNCDKLKLESLCKEKNIIGGLIFEDLDQDESGVYNQFNQTNEAAEEVESVTPTDILSSLYGTNSSVTSMTESNYDEVLSSSTQYQPLSNDEIVRLEGEAPLIDQLEQVQLQQQFQFSQPQTPLQQQRQDININDYDDFYWVSPA